MTLLHEEVQQGYNDGFKNKQPTQPDNPFYLDGYNKGKADKEKLNQFINSI